MLNIPNILSCLRLLITPALLFFAWNENPFLFLLFFVAALLSDALDGYLARKLNQISELGSRLDSLGDFAMYLAVPLCAWWLWPDLVLQEILYVALTMASFIVPILVGFLKYRRLTSYHTWGAKTAAVALGIALLILFVGGPSWPFRIAVLFFVIAELEEISITAILPQWQADVPTLWHALKLAGSSTTGQDEGK